MDKKMESNTAEQTAEQYYDEYIAYYTLLGQTFDRLPVRLRGDGLLIDTLAECFENHFEKMTIHHKGRQFEIKKGHSFDPSITINTTIADLFNKQGE